MKLWTMQPASLLNEIEKNGVFRCDESKSFNLTKENSLKPQYNWLINQMEQKIGKRPDGVKFPIWAWHTWEFKRQMPDPDSAAFLKRDGDRVFLTIDIPEEKVVLTDFDAWQNVMTDGFVSAATNEREYDREAELLDTTDDTELAKLIQKSWQNVFIVDKVDNEFLTRGKYIQATFWEIIPEYIIDVQKLNSTK